MKTAIPVNPYALEHYEHPGALMRDVREDLGLDVQTVGTQLHIRNKYIIAIEENRVEDLPGTVYARGYIHSYAEMLGLNPTEMVDAFDGFGTAPVEVKKAQSKSDKISKESSYKKGVVAGAAIGVVGVALAVWQLSDAMMSTPQYDAGLGVPNTFTEHLESQLIITDVNKECLSYKAASAFPPCYPLSLGLPEARPYALRPVQTIMARSLHGEL